jgi:SAM-dependent methyltransferase
VSGPDAKNPRARNQHDWEVIASRDPWFGVLTADEFRSDRIDDAARQRFFQTGKDTIDGVLGWFDDDIGARPTGRALDIGCGVGRLTRAMAAVTTEAVGYDISETMASLARDGAPANMTTTSRLPDGPFDWINSSIVFQHIPPDEGVALLDACLARAAPGAFLSVQITGWRDGVTPSPSPLARFLRFLLRRKHRQPGGAIDPLIQMHDYNLSDVLRCVTAHGFERVVLHHTNHGGYHGACIIGRRD